MHRGCLPNFHHPFHWSLQHPEMPEQKGRQQLAMPLASPRPPRPKCSSQSSLNFLRVCGSTFAIEYLLRPGCGFASLLSSHKEGGVATTSNSYALRSRVSPSHFSNCSARLSLRRRTRARFAASSIPSGPRRETSGRRIPARYDWVGASVEARYSYPSQGRRFPGASGLRADRAVFRFRRQSGRPMWTADRGLG